MESKFYILSLNNVPRRLEEVITDKAIEMGASGTSEGLSFVQEDKYLNVQTFFPEFFTLNIYFEEIPNESFLNWLQEVAPESNSVLLQEPVKDWLEEWKKNFTAFELLEGLWVVPSWLDPKKIVDSMGDAPKAWLSIDPGMAFGTGTHETTQLCAELIFVLKDHGFKKVLDVGAGTGILSLVAAAAGASEIKAIEIDDIARQVARENLAKNPAYSPKVRVVDHQIHEELEIFDLVVANIIDGVLLDLRAELLRVVREGGFLVLSGVLNERAKDFIEGFYRARTDLALIDERSKGLWHAYVFKRQ